AMLALWRSLAEGGGIPLPRRDPRTYGDFRLALQPGAGAGAPQRYRYEFESGRLTDARAWGSGARLDFEVTAVDSQGCDRRVLATL
ncbi:MAG TPA: hypothetical protein VMQ62_13770, partial [Dongiaceae bacterium]|nr:hypothetical protein [Dongiaceae bacterium]